MLPFLILLAYIVNDTFGTLCPPIFGQFECPLNLTCITDECYSDNNIIAPYDCKEVKCNANFRCYKAIFFNSFFQFFIYIKTLLNEWLIDNREFSGIKSSQKYHAPLFSF